MKKGKLIIFTRYPECGYTKTRLIGTLGAQGAADLHRQMTERTIRTARQARDRGLMDLEICYTGGDDQNMRDWLGADLRFCRQIGPDLGERMSHAFRLGFEEGYGRIVLVGTDCPELTADILERAFQTLQRHDVVLGPTRDGGYYLIGMTRAIPHAFTAIPWGTAMVLRTTLDILSRAGISWTLVDKLTDVDTAADLATWERAVDAVKTDRPSVSVVIPALNEAVHIAEAIRSVRQHDPLEVIVADGTSTDGTADIARQAADKVVVCPRGRGRQMNAGAAMASGDVLLFLHADTRLPSNALANVASVMEGSKYVGGAFDLGIDTDRWFLGCIAARASFRSRVNRIPYGDQAIFIDRRYFESVGRFAEIAIMEDVDLMRRIKKDGKKIHIFRDRVMTSPRRWEAEGPLYTTIRNQILLLLYYLGVSPNKLAQLYRPHSDTLRQFGRDRTCP